MTLLSNEDYLRQRFELRWYNLEKKAKQRSLPIPDKESLFEIIRYKYEKNFVCEYCGQRLLICDTIPPHFKSFSIDHRTSLDAGGDNTLENFAVTCTRCNIIKGTMTEQTYREFLKPFLHNQDLLDQVFKEMFNGRFANKLEREQKWKEPPSDSTLPGCIGNFGKPTTPNGPCSECRDKDFCEQATDGFGIDVQAWHDGGSKYTAIIGKDWPSCLGQADGKQRQGIYCSLKKKKCKHTYLCGYIWRT